MTQYVLAFDQGTTSSRAIAFNHRGDRLSITQQWQAERQFAPAMSDDQRNALLSAWHQAVDRTRWQG